MVSTCSGLEQVDKNGVEIIIYSVRIIVKNQNIREFRETLHDAGQFSSGMKVISHRQAVAGGAHPRRVLSFCSLRRNKK